MCFITFAFSNMFRICNGSFTSDRYVSSSFTALVSPGTATLALVSPWKAMLALGTKELTYLVDNKRSNTRIL